MIATQRRRGASFVYSFLAASLMCAAAGCDSAQDSTTSAAPQANAPAQAPPPIVPAPAVTQASWAPDALEELLAPIALYPDVLLSQILAASVNSQEVLDAGNWLLQHEALSGDALDSAAQQAGFGPSMLALIHFPTVVDMMCQQLDWTRQLGSAFSSDQKAVLDAVQRLRLQAANAGNLKSTPEQKVEKKQEADKVVVEVKPAEPTVVYVPQYDPQVVYAAPPPQEDTVSTDTAVAAGLLAFGLGVIVGNAFDDDDYCYPHWGHGAVYYGPRPFYPPAYVYRPAYGPAFRPAYGYRPPANYRHSYNNIDVNRNVNVNVRNTNDYFNRFSGNENLRAGGARSPLQAGQQPAGQQRVAQRDAAQRDPAQRDVAQRDAPQRDAARSDSWKGQSTYAGARDGAASTRLDDGAGAQRQDLRLQDSPANRPERTYSDVSETDRGGQRPREDRGYDDGANAEAREPQLEARNTERPAAAEREHAFAGARSEDGGSFDRAASARGRASTEGQRAARGGGSRRR
jgi:hypothetical protein